MKALAKRRESIVEGGMLAVLLREEGGVVLEKFYGLTFGCSNINHVLLMKQDKLTMDFMLDDRQ